MVIRKSRLQVIRNSRLRLIRLRTIERQSLWNMMWELRLRIVQRQSLWILRRWILIL